MTISSANKNKLYTDAEYIKRLGLDPSLEGKPEINAAIEEALKNTSFQQRVLNDPDEDE